MNAAVVIDSSALFSLVSFDDANHERAVAVSHSLFTSGRILLLSDEVFAETLNIIGKKLGRDKQLTIGREFLHSGAYIFPPTGEEERVKALIKLEKLPASVSYTDAVVMAVADSFETKEIFGFDAVFAEQGYRLPETA